jgi:hypothetical protein
MMVVILSKLWGEELRLWIWRCVGVLDRDTCSFLAKLLLAVILALDLGHVHTKDVISISLIGCQDSLTCWCPYGERRGCN